LCLSLYGPCRIRSVCWAEYGCGLSNPPPDLYPIPKTKLQKALPVIIVVPLLMLLALGIKYWRSRKSKRTIKAELEAFKDVSCG
jgi:hypothetical protein